MDYKQLAADDQFPTVNSGLVGENKYAFGADIPLLVGISVWDSSASYLAGHTVIYNSSTTKGIFLILDTTTPGDSPDGTGYDKFKSIALAFVPNAVTYPSSSGYYRTIRLSITEPISAGTYLHSISTSFTEVELEAANITAKISYNGQFASVQVKSITSGNSGQLAIYLEHYGSSSSTTYYVDIVIQL